MTTAATPDPTDPSAPTPAPPRATYGSLLRRPGAAAFFLPAGAGRVGIAMTGLGLVWLVHGATGSYGSAGTVTGAFAVAEAVVGPRAARLVDRHGQTRVLPALAVVHAGAVSLLLVAVGRGAPTWSLAAVAVLAGASIPQLGALSAARWVALVRRHHHGAPGVLATAFALESVANASAYLAGPAAVSAIAAGGHPASGSVCAAALVVAGALVLASRRGSAPPVGHAGGTGAADGSGAGDDPPVAGGAAPATHGRPGGPAFVALVGIAVGMGAFFGANQVSLAPFAVEAGRPTAATALYAVGGVSGLLTAWAYGLRRWRAAPHRQLVVAASALALGCVPLVLVSGILPMAAALASSGAAVPVVLVLSSVLVQRCVDRAVLTEAFTWLNSATAAGSAGAAALAGALVDVGGARAGLAVALAAGVVAALLAVGASRVLSTPPPWP